MVLKSKKPVKAKSQAKSKASSAKPTSNGVSAPPGPRDITFKDPDQQYARVIKMLGGGWLEAAILDGKGPTRQCRISGRMQHFRNSANKIRPDDIVLLAPRDFEEKCDVIHKFSNDELRQLKQNGELQVDERIYGRNAINGDDEDVVQFADEGAIIESFAEAASKETDQELLALAGYVPSQREEVPSNHNSRPKPKVRKPVSKAADSYSPFNPEPTLSPKAGSTVSHHRAGNHGQDAPSQSPRCSDDPCKIDLCLSPPAIVGDVHCNLDPRISPTAGNTDSFSQPTVSQNPVDNLEPCLSPKASSPKTAGQGEAELDHCTQGPISQSPPSLAQIEESLAKLHAELERMFDEALKSLDIEPKSSNETLICSSESVPSTPDHIRRWDIEDMYSFQMSHAEPSNAFPVSTGGSIAAEVTDGSRPQVESTQCTHHVSPSKQKRDAARARAHLQYKQEQATKAAKIYTEMLASAVLCAVISSLQSSSHPPASPALVAARCTMQKSKHDICNDKVHAEEPLDSRTEANGRDIKVHDAFLEGDPQPQYPLYTDAAPPEKQSIVVVRCDRVDAYGIWGSLPEWGAYDIAYMKHEDTAMKNKDRKAFLASTRNTNARVFAAEVKEIEECSDATDGPSTLARPRYHITVNRRSLRKGEEEAAIDRWHCAMRAARLVEALARRTGVAPVLARRVLLYNIYEQAASDSSNDEDDMKLDRCCAAPQLLTQLGRTCTAEAAAPVMSVLQLADLPDDFPDVLLEMCRAERHRLCKPIAFSREYELRSDAGARSVAAVRAAAAAAEGLLRPECCGPLLVTVAGPPRYKFTTHCDKEDVDVAAAFMDSAAEHARAMLAKRSNEDEHDVKPHCEESLISSNDADKIQPTLNIGLIGDVAHGKSTLCRALTGKRTQQHSSEHKAHGATIRLGYANCRICRCTNPACEPPSCFSTTSGENLVAQAPSCLSCGSPTAVVKCVSFVDCPGHAELMTTMLSGASAFDAVLLVADASTSCPSMQAAAHLSALSAVGGDLHGKVAVVQSKADVLFQPSADGTINAGAAISKLKAHRDKSARSLRGTVAEDAPTLPVASTLGIGLDSIAMWLAFLPERPATTLTAPLQLQALRSFDINSPGILATEMTGGVIGGSCLRGTVSAGDLLEVRPGTFVERSSQSGRSSFSVQPLFTRVAGIQSGDTQLRSAKPGGLIALRTTMCPSLCASDRLKGCVVGKPGTLPPVWDVLLLDKLLVISENVLEESNDESSSDSDSDNSKAEQAQRAQQMRTCARNLKTGDQIKLHSGSSYVNGVVVKVSIKRGKVEAALLQPLCAALGSPVAIEKQCTEDGPFCLVAHACLWGGEESALPEGLPEVAVEEEGVAPISCLDADANDIDKDEVDIGTTSILHEPDYLCEHLADALLARTRGGGRNMVVPCLELSREGGAHSIWENFAAVAEKLKRPPGHLLAFLMSKGKLRCSRCKEEGKALRIRMTPSKLLERLIVLIRQYSREFIVCQECRSSHTDLVRDRSLRATSIEVVCRTCSARRFVEADVSIAA